jgi:hypothetical protein
MDLVGIMAEVDPYPSNMAHPSILLEGTGLESPMEDGR